MKRVIVVHQWMAGADGDWRPWLMIELEKLGYEVFVPEMPDIDTPVIEKWVSRLSEVVGKPDANTYFVGHSIGCQTILRYLETINTPVGGAIFVAGWFNLENLEDEETVAIAQPWIETPINLQKVKSVLPEATLVISENDPFGCLEENKAKFAEVTTKGIVMPNAGHLSADDGFTELSVIVDELKGFLAPSLLKKRLAEEGFANIYEWTDQPNTEYQIHSHKGKVCFYVTNGNISMNIDGNQVTVRSGERIDVPVGVPHTAKVGPEGRTFIVGEEIKGDS